MAILLSCTMTKQSYPSLCVAGRLTHGTGEMHDMTDTTRELDLMGLNCPLPILRIKQTMARMASGEILQVVGTEPATERELKIFCKQAGHELLAYQETPQIFIYTLCKG